MRDAETTTGTSFATSDSESYQDSEPEIPISSAQWPPSSPPRHIQEQLPPDSSMEASAQTIELEEEIGEVHSIRKRRKLSHSSTSSCSVISNEEHLTTSSRRLTKTIRSSPALPTTPSRQELVTSRPSETEIQEITMEQRGLVKVNYTQLHRAITLLIFSRILISRTLTAPQVMLVLPIPLLQKNPLLQKIPLPHGRHASDVMYSFIHPGSYHNTKSFVRERQIEMAKTLMTLTSLRRLKTRRICQCYFRRLQTKP